MGFDRADELVFVFDLPVRMLSIPPELLLKQFFFNRWARHLRMQPKQVNNPNLDGGGQIYLTDSTQFRACQLAPPCAKGTTEKLQD